MFIDEPLHRTALVSGHPTPELMFGESDWAGYLDARAFTRSYGDQELSVRFMTEINQRAGQFGPQDSGVFAEGTRWAVLGRPLTAEEAHTVEANPHLLHIEPGTPPLGNMSAVSYERKDAAAIRNELQSLSDWYNNARGAPGTDPYRLAAELQQRFVSIHPFTDYNGRSSRLLMNWALEREGLSPSVLPNFDRDILATSDEWAETVRAGSRTFAERADRLDRLGASADPVEIFGLQRLRALYNGHSGYIAPLRAGDDHDIYSVQKFLDVLEAGDKS
ncbi:Fic family protein [Nocardia sp. alder85J]|uniref:Fic family protein n=1 Tax=Nocardia sp. alder85J TaxID=2862949 RepID=UPI001CD4497B|nr:Fic family protein [Nocardia sp. alder85J]MCX4097982.1 Fic family protein [Nocardia sp. alder85J]